jgi:DNA mismatch repair protein MutS2
MEKRLEELITRHQEDLLKTEKERKAIMEKAKIEAKEVLAGANKQIENTIRQIKESQAEKEKTRTVRKQLEEFKEHVEKVDADDEERILHKIEKLKEREDRVKKKQPKVVNPVPQELEKVKIEVGDKVRVSYLKKEGENIATIVTPIVAKKAINIKYSSALGY